MLLPLNIVSKINMWYTHNEVVFINEHNKSIIASGNDTTGNNESPLKLESIINKVPT